MSAECNHDCSACGEQCAERQPESFRQPLNELSRVRHVIGVISGKGGVGKSMVACLLASLLRKKEIMSLSSISYWPKFCFSE